MPAYSEKLFATICQRIADGQSLKTICSEKGMPSQQAVYTWVREKDGALEKYARAREEQADYYADEIIDIADACEDPQKARVQIDARKWKASKLAPRKYGDKLELGGTGDDGEIKITVTRKIVRT